MPIDFNIFNTAGTYPKMLAKIAIFDAIAVFIALYIIGSKVDFLAEYVFWGKIPIWNVEVPFGMVVIALFIAFLSRIFKFHD